MLDELLFSDCSVIFTVLAELQMKLCCKNHQVSLKSESAAEEMYQEHITRLQITLSFPFRLQPSSSECFDALNSIQMPFLLAVSSHTC